MHVFIAIVLATLNGVPIDAEIVSLVGIAPANASACVAAVQKQIDANGPAPKVDGKPVTLVPLCLDTGLNAPKP